MAQTTFGQTDALALAIVAWLTTNSPTFCIPVDAERRFRRNVDLPTIPTFDQPASIDVFGGGVQVHRESIATFSSHYTANIFIQQRTTGAADVEAQCALLALLQSQIIEGLRTFPFALASAFHPVKANQLVFLDSRPGDKGLYDLIRLEEFNVFESDTILIFKASV